MVYVLFLLYVMYSSSVEILSYRYNTDRYVAP